MYHRKEKASGSNLFIPSEKLKNSSALKDKGNITNKGAIKKVKTHAQINKGISPALKRMLAKARMTLASEIACALEIDEEAAVDKITQYLPEEDPDDGL